MDTTIKRKGVPLLNYMILLIVFLFLVALAMAGSPTGPGNTGDLVPTPPQTGTKNTVCGDKAFFTATKILSFIESGKTIIVLNSGEISHVIKLIEGKVLFAVVTSSTDYAFTWGEMPAGVFYKRWEYNGWSRVKNGLNRALEVFRWKDVDLPQGAFNSESKPVGKLLNEKGFRIADCFSK